jgi:site-specific recombinase XerD
MESYEQYEKDCNKIRKENEKLISLFDQWMVNNNVSSKTSDKHCSNIDFYINEFLLYEEAIPAIEGVNRIEMFLGYWFIKKAMWASKTSIKENATSLKKFYQFLHESKKISKDSFEDLKDTIKEGMHEWLETLERYDNPDIEDIEDVWY